MIIAEIGRGRMRRVAPCGAELETGQRRLRGAALRAKLECQLRRELRPAGSPLGRYDCRIESNGGGGIGGLFVSVVDESMTATFMSRESGAQIVVTEIRVNDDGEIVQWGSNHGALAL
jgi:hypothetical protein